VRADAHGRLLRTGAGATLLALVLCAANPANAGAIVVINNTDPPGVGFNDPTPAAPVGGNTGTTIGQQRLGAFPFAANSGACA